MPVRRTPLVSGCYYHIFNRGINREKTFTIKRDYERALETLRYYLPVSHRLKYSHFLAKSSTEKYEILTKLAGEPHHATVIAFCLMPNHYHLLLRQNEDGGISKYMADFQNSYTKYFDAKHRRSGALFN